MQRRLLGAFDPIERIWATVSSSRAGIMIPEVEDAGTTEGGREGGREVMWEPLKLFNAAQGEPSIFCKSWDFATKRGGGHKKVHFFNKKIICLE